MRITGSRLVLIGLVVGYLVARIGVLVGGRVFTSYDTFSYAYRGVSPPDHGPLVSLTGHAARLWGVPVLYVLLPGDNLRAYAQWALGTVAWVALALVVWSLLRHPAARLVGAAGVLVLALTPQVGSWDFAILSESLTISLGVLTLALLLLWWNKQRATPSRTVLIGLILVATWWTFTRPDIRVFTVFLVLALGLAAWRRRDRDAWIAAGVLVLAIAWCSAIAPVTQRTYLDRGYGFVGADEGLMYQLRLQVFPDPKVKEVFQRELGMPECPAAAAIAADPVWRIGDFHDAYRSCPDLAAWGDQHRDLMAEFARAAPGLYLDRATVLLGATLTGLNLAHTPAVLPPVVPRLAFPPQRYSPWLPLAAFALTVAAAAIARTRRWFWPMVALAGVCLISAAAAVVFGVGEFQRFGVQEAIGLRTSIVVLLAAMLDSLLSRRLQSADVDERARSRVASPG